MHMVKRYKLVPRPENSWDDNPCWYCCFGKEDGECHAPKEIAELDDDCGFKWSGTEYVYVEADE